MFSFTIIRGFLVSICMGNKKFIRSKTDFYLNVSALQGALFYRPVWGLQVARSNLQAISYNLWVT